MNQQTMKDLIKIQSKVIKVRTRNFNGVQYKSYVSEISLHEWSVDVLTLKRL
jgi:hypothetical protein